MKIDFFVIMKRFIKLRRECKELEDEKHVWNRSFIDGVKFALDYIEGIEKKSLKEIYDSGSDLEIQYIKRTCECCPSQWEIKLTNGKMVYVRYRWGKLSIRISHGETNDIWNAVAGEVILEKKIGTEFDGYLDDNVMKQYLKQALENYKNYKGV